MRKGKNIYIMQIYARKGSAREYSAAGKRKTQAKCARRQEGIMRGGGVRMRSSACAALVICSVCAPGVRARAGGREEGCSR